MNLPNQITVLRVCLIPLYLYLYLAAPLGDFFSPWAALAVFSLAAATDALDGYLARRNKQVTNFGKLMDPLADKLLVSAALIAMAGNGVLPAWVVVVLISREFFISGFRQLALEQQLVLAASFWAKMKTVVQMVMVIYLLVPVPAFLLEINFINTLADILAWLLVAASVVLSILSAVEYAWMNRKVFT
jgi:CDP-diacylglycerol--glycerol-3-phosphate 3-phosphatidyltransferase